MAECCVSLANAKAFLGIVQLEMVIILVALRLLKDMWRCKRILIKCARNVWILTAASDIDVTYTHVKGVKTLDGKISKNKLIICNCWLVTGIGTDISLLEIDNDV